ncbi:MAG TPA: hypothetical protein VIV58_36125, partial [Kofleriaceae bacterium]
AGQMGTKVTRGSRGWVIAGVATLIVAAGAGGFVVATSMGKVEPSHVGAPNPLETTMSTDKGSAGMLLPTPVEMPATPPPPVAKPDTATAAGASAAAAPKVDAKATPKPATKTETKPDAKTVAKATPKVETKATPKTETKSTKSTKTVKKPKGDDDLFDDRH